MDKQKLAGILQDRSKQIELSRRQFRRLLTHSSLQYALGMRSDKRAPTTKARIFGIDLPFSQRVARIIKKALLAGILVRLGFVILALIVGIFLVDVSDLKSGISSFFNTQSEARQCTYYAEDKKWTDTVDSLGCPSTSIRNGIKGNLQ